MKSKYVCRVFYVGRSKTSQKLHFCLHISVLGALLQKLPGHLIDGTSLFEVQNLLETFNEQAEPDLAAAIRHFLLFDFEPRTTGMAMTAADRGDGRGEA